MSTSPECRPARLRDVCAAFLASAALLAAGASPVGAQPLLEQAIITADDGVAADSLGLSLVLSPDGHTALVGAYNVNGGRGAAYFFERNGTTWTQQTKLTAFDGAVPDNYGLSVALSQDGTTALIGADYKTVNGVGAVGVAYVYVHDGTSWNFQAKLLADDGAFQDYFGTSAALSSDGNTALIGAFNKMVNGRFGEGAAYVFVRSGTTWTQQARLTSSDGAEGDRFGRRQVGLSSDGTTALIGAYGKDIGGNEDQGAAYVFTRSGSTWTETAQLLASDGAEGDKFGAAVQLDDAGTVALVSASYKTFEVNQPAQGAAYVFVRDGAAWVEQARLVASDGTGSDYYGQAVALSRDGTRAIVGAFQNFSRPGAAYVYTRNGSTWPQTQKLTASDGVAGQAFGSAVALNGDGTTALSGSYKKMVGGNANQGAAYAYQVALPTPSPTKTSTPSPPATGTRTPTPTPTATSTLTPVPTTTATLSATATPVPTTTATLSATATPVPTETPTHSPTETPTASATPTESATATPDVTATPEATTTPEPTATATPAHLDHFTCYKASPREAIQPPNVTLVDTFGSSTAAVRKSKYLCTPTDKLGEGPSAPAHPEHEKGYLLKRISDSIRVSHRRFVDQFGTVVVQLLKPSHLFVPSVTSPNATPPLPGAFVVDHFQCYKVKDRTATRFVPVSNVTLADQFGPMTVDVRKPSFLCAPVDKNGESPGAESHAAHLMCYQVKQTDGLRFARRALFVNDRFGAETLAVVKPTELCVPASENP